MSSSNQSQPIKLGIADDDPIVRRSLEHKFSTSKNVDVMWVATDGNEAHRNCTDQDMPRIDVLLLDHDMPHKTGLEVAKLLKDSQSSIKCVLLTTFIADYLYDEALAAGVLGFISKEDSLDNYEEIIKATLQGTIAFSQGAASGLTGFVTSNTTKSFRPKNEKTHSFYQQVYLTGREKQVLKAIIDGHSRKEIAKMLFISENTVKTHMANINGKLGTQDRLSAALVALKFNLV